MDQNFEALLSRWESANAELQQANEKHQEAVRKYFSMNPADRTDAVWNNVMALGQSFTAASEKAKAAWRDLEDIMRRVMTAQPQR
jgi:hypothetical protein